MSGEFSAHLADAGVRPKLPNSLFSGLAALPFGISYSELYSARQT
jgi:hypothetical protein